jgi:hypothetical protein
MPFTTIRGGDMNMQTILTFMIGLLVGVSLTATVAVLTDNPTLETVNKAMTDCEKSLPRDQHCYIIAVPPSLD